MSLSSRSTIVFVACLLTTTRATGDGPATPVLDWKLAPSAVAIYDRFAVTNAGGVESVAASGGDPTTVRGHDLRDNGHYLPVTAGIGDIAAVFAFRLPDGVDAKALPLSFDLRDGAPIEGRGSFHLDLDPTRGTRPGLALAWTFASKGSPKGGDQYELHKGMADVLVRWKDGSGGPPESSRVRLRYRRVPLAKNDKDPPKDVDETVEYRLRTVRAGRDDAFTKDVAKAIDEGVAWIRKQQKPDGGFPPNYEWVIGTTALALLTLAECEVPRDDPALKQGLIWLSLQSPVKTYDRALALMAMERAYTPASEEQLIASGRLASRIRNLTPERRAWAERIAAELEASAVSPGSFGYPAAHNSTLPIDSSNTQYAALGLRAASRLSIPTKDATWLGLARHFGILRERHGPRSDVVLRHDGDKSPAPGETAAREKARPLEVLGFLYAPDRATWGSMTCAGIACLELARHELVRARSPRLTPAVEAEIEERIRSGWAWLDRHWGVDRHPEKATNDWTLYYLYALERAAVFSRVREVNGKDWYFEGATELLARRKAEGFWVESGASDLVETCFAVLFLKKATPPLTDSDGK